MLRVGCNMTHAVIINHNNGNNKIPSKKKKKKITHAAAALSHKARDIVFRSINNAFKRCSKAALLSLLNS